MPDNRPQSSGQPPKKKQSSSSKRFAVHAERQAAKQQAAQEARRAHTRTYGILAIVLAVVIVAVLVIVKVAGGGSGSGTGDQSSPPAGTPIPTATLTKLQLDSGLASCRRADRWSHHHAANGQWLVPDVGRQARRACASSVPSSARIAQPSGGRCTSLCPSSARSVPSPADSPLGNPGWRRSHPDFLRYDVQQSLTLHSPRWRSTRTSRRATGYVPLQAPTGLELTLWEDTNGGSFPFIDFGEKVLPSALVSVHSVVELAFFRCGGTGG